MVSACRYGPDAGRSPNVVISRPISFRRRLDYCIWNDSASTNVCCVPHEKHIKHWGRSPQSWNTQLEFTPAMSLSKFISRSAVRAASTSTQTTKAAGDISSVFPSLRPDYKPEPLPARFQDLKAQIFEKNKDAITKSWERLLPSLDEEVQKIKAKGSDVRAHVTRNTEQKTDFQIPDHSLN